MRPVVAGWAAVPLFLRQILDSRSTIVVGEVNCFGPCVSGPKLRISPASGEQCLEPIICCRPIRYDFVGVRCQPKLYKKRPTIVSRARRPSVYVDETHLTDRARPYVTDLAHELPRQFTFEEEIERINLLADRRLRECCSARISREWENALAEVGRSTRVN